jgi:hypothetical protein
MKDIAGIWILPPRFLAMQLGTICLHGDVERMYNRIADLVLANRTTLVLSTPGGFQSVLLMRWEIGWAIMRCYGTRAICPASNG